MTETESFLETFDVGFNCSYCGRSYDIPAPNSYECHGCAHVKSYDGPFLTLTILAKLILPPPHWVPEFLAFRTYRKHRCQSDPVALERYHAAAVKFLKLARAESDSVIIVGTEAAIGADTKSSGPKVRVSRRRSDVPTLSCSHRVDSFDVANSAAPPIEPPAPPRGGNPRHFLRDCKALINSLLKDGPVSAESFAAAFRDKSFSQATIKKAKRFAGVRSKTDPITGRGTVGYSTQMSESASAVAVVPPRAVNTVPVAQVDDELALAEELGILNTPHLTTVSASESVERWHAIGGTGGMYCISTLGRFRTHSGKVLRCNRSGKCCVRMADGGQINIKPAEAVLTTFGCRPAGAVTVGFRDGNPRNAALANVYWKPVVPDEPLVLTSPAEPPPPKRGYRFNCAELIRDRLAAGAIPARPLFEELRAKYTRPTVWRAIRDAGASVFFEPGGKRLIGVIDHMSRVTASDPIIVPEVRLAPWRRRPPHPDVIAALELMCEDKALSLEAAAALAGISSIELKTKVFRQRSVTYRTEQVIRLIRLISIERAGLIPAQTSESQPEVAS